MCHETANYTVRPRDFHRNCCVGTPYYESEFRSQRFRNNDQTVKPISLMLVLSFDDDYIQVMVPLQIYTPLESLTNTLYKVMIISNWFQRNIWRSNVTPRSVLGRWNGTKTDFRHLFWGSKTWRISLKNKGENQKKDHTTVPINHAHAQNHNHFILSSRQQNNKTKEN